LTHPAGVKAGVQRDHFARLVSDWSFFGPPLRPAPQDTAQVQRVADTLGANARVLVLGLTPETVGCRWPQGTSLLALDHSAAMVASLWPQAGAPPGSTAVIGHWLQLPLADASMDIVCADGCHTQLPYPQGFSELGREIARVLKPDGLFVTRIFIRADQPESADAIGSDLAAGLVSSVHALKLRLLGALHGHSGPGTCLDDVWQAWTRMPPLPAELAQQRGWTPGEVGGIQAYAGLATRYYLPTLQELRALHAGHFDERRCHFGNYEAASCCPTLVLSAR